METLVFIIFSLAKIRCNFSFPTNTNFSLGAGKMKALGWWLIVVGTLRLASVWFGFFDIWALRLAVFSNTTSN
ncbi:hypothetical protein TSUD_308450 [Trifolium subterraneum]|nr:hypothetical protein TSUD_308450 [Trifolium subterraneum]